MALPRGVGGLGVFKVLTGLPLQYCVLRLHRGFSICGTCHVEGESHDWMSIDVDVEELSAVPGVESPCWTNSCSCNAKGKSAERVMPGMLVRTLGTT